MSDRTGTLENNRRTSWARSWEEVAIELHVQVSAGLSNEEALERLRRDGPNQLREERKTSALARFLGQFKSPVVITLIVGAVLSGILGEVADAIAIGLILVINAVIGYVQEFRAEQAMEALKKLSTPRARVLRGGKVIEVGAEQVCMGDILVLEAGDFVPADARLAVASQLSAAEAVLTGESIPVEKSTAPVGEESSLGDRINMIFGGTTIATGSGRAIITATGMKTELGRIAGLLQESQSGPTPLQQRLEQVGNRLLLLCAAVVALVAILGLLHGVAWFEVVMSAISLAVAAIPEGLPTVVTVTLALAVRRMSHRNAIVRQLTAVETLGSTDVICTDKTGTLTTGHVRVREVVIGGRIVDVSDRSIDSDPCFQQLISCCVLCNNASANDDGTTTGDPTEVALLLLAKGHGITPEEVHEQYSRKAEWAFDSVRKRMSVMVANGTVFLKGAPESVFPLCDPKSISEEEVRAAMETLSSKGRRILALATRRIEADSLPRTMSDVEQDVTFLGLVSMADPPRPESITAIQQCKQAGIRVVMITGDHPVTAKAIGMELGIVEPGRFDEVLTGPDLERMTLDELRSRVDKVAVYARVSPEHKLNIVRAWKERGSVVAMTGDGVNDAPALKEASIGVSMGKGGTEVARQASSMILTDDNFATIVSAIEEGRAIYGNIRRTIQYLLSGNFAEILVMLGAALAGWPVPLAPIHLLWINLVTDGLPALALAAEPVPKDGLRETSKPSTKLSRRFYGNVAWIGGLAGLMTLAVYGYSLAYDDEQTARTNAFSFLVFEELFRSFASRSETKTFFEMGFRSNVFHLVAVSIPIGFQIVLHHVHGFESFFKVQPISWGECLTFTLLALVPVTVIELLKLMRRRANLEKTA